MAAQAHANPGPEAEQPVRLRRPLPPREPATAAPVRELLRLWERRPGPSERQRVLVNMVSTVDGRATLGGRSAPLSGRADRELFHGLRAAVDAVLVGAGTVRMERYGRIIREESVRRLPLAPGLAAGPPA